MEGNAGLDFQMLGTILLSFGIGLAIILAIMLYFGVPVYIALLVAAAIFLVQFYVTPKIINLVTKLRYINPEEYPQLQEMVSELAIKAGIPKPRIAIVPAVEPNVFVFGRSPKGATLAVHEGLLGILDGLELKSAIAHELWHIKQWDFAVLTVTSFIPMLAYSAAQKILWTNFFEDKKGNSTYEVLLGVLAFTIYFISSLTILPLSKYREKFADEYAVKIMGKPESLASALYKISAFDFKTKNGSRSGTIARQFYIVDYFNINTEMKELKNHYSEFKRLLPETEIITVTKETQSSRNGLIGMLNSLVYTHPPTYLRLADINAYANSNKN